VQEGEPVIERSVKMNKIISTLSTIAFIAGSASAFAAEADFKKADANGDGKVTLDGGKVAHTDWTEDAFKKLDKDGDGALSKEEYEAATSEKKS
jgi:hypothetical protein